MANEIRVRSNFQSGTITDNPLTNVATTINSAAFASLPAITSTSHLPIILDPLATAGAPEIVYITAHTASATSATVVRGQEGTVARQHLTGMTWRHAPTIYDYDYLATSSTRPGTPYYGQTVYESDTDTITARSAAGAWQTAVALGAWTAYTPTDTNVTLGNGTRVSRYARIGRTIHFFWSLTWGSTTAYVGTVSVGLPVASASTGRWAVNTYILDSGTQNYGWGGFIDSSGTAAQPLAAAGGGINATTPQTWAVNDRLVVSGTYEAAS